MSQENVKVVQAALDAFNRRDGDGFGAILAEDAEIPTPSIASSVLN